MFKIIIHAVLIIAFTILSQVGGLAWLIALRFKNTVLAFLIFYITLSVSALWIAPFFGRTPIPCLSNETLRMQSKLYCALNRQYVAPRLYETLSDYAGAMSTSFPGTVTRVLDANFPYLDGFPLLPHLSHDDGRKVDLAFYYADEDGYAPGAAKSPIGYFAFEQGPTECPRNALTLRWDMAWLQPHWAEYQPEIKRMTAALAWLGGDDRIGKVFIEPHLKTKFGSTNPKMRFQGCRAARHDDHIHIQLKP